jgi:hypothetical protein
MKHRKVTVGVHDDYNAHFFDVTSTRLFFAKSSSGHSAGHDGESRRV